jgi:hypothetical protein
MNKRVDVLAVVVFLILLASLLAAAKGHGGLYGFSSGV